MKVIRKILYVIAGLLVLLTILIVICAYNPALTAKMQGLIFRGRAVEVKDISTDTAGEGEAATEEAPAEEHRMRTIEELGISPDSIIKDLDAYYANCREQIIAHGFGTYSFENVVSSESLVQQVYSSYSNKDYVAGYMDEALNEMGAYSYDMNLLVEELEGKNYRLTHQITID